MGVLGGFPFEYISKLKLNGKETLEFLNIKQIFGNNKLIKPLSFFVLYDKLANSQNRVSFYSVVFFSCQRPTVANLNYENCNVPQSKERYCPYSEAMYR